MAYTALAAAGISIIQKIAVVRESGSTAPKSNECPLVHRFEKD
jgi:hypothetical protein